MKQLKIGARVRYVGNQATYSNAALYLLIGRTGVIRAKSGVDGMDGFVEMDEGAYGQDAQAATLELIDEGQQDRWTLDAVPAPALETA